MRFRPIQPQDRDRIHEILIAVGNFNPTEIRIAMELVEDALEKKGASDYIVHVLEDESTRVQAFTCFGPTPLTDATYDFYWAAVDPQYQGKGIGITLFQFVEAQIRERGGKLMMCETSSQESYRRVVQLYERLNYEFVARIQNFYRNGDDKIIYKKVVDSKPDH